MTWTSQRTFEAVESYEAACDAGTHRRVLVEDDARGPVGLAWAPIGLAEIPPVVGDRVMALQGPDGSTLLFVPLSALHAVLSWAARRKGVDPDTEKRFLALQSLTEESPEPAVHRLFDLIAWLVRYGAATARPEGSATEARLRVTNEHDHPITLVVEPWAEEHLLEPNRSLEVVGSGPPGVFEVSTCKDNVTVYGWSGSTVSVLRDGVDVAVGSKEIPSP